VNFRHKNYTLKMSIIVYCAKINFKEFLLVSSTFFLLLSLSHKRKSISNTIALLMEQLTRQIWGIFDCGVHNFIWTSIDNFSDWKFSDSKEDGFKKPIFRQTSLTNAPNWNEIFSLSFLKIKKEKNNHKKSRRRNEHHVLERKKFFYELLQSHHHQKNSLFIPGNVASIKCIIIYDENKVE
jgi:hypothetical protein